MRQRIRYAGIFHESTRGLDSPASRTDDPGKAPAWSAHHLGQDDRLATPNRPAGAPQARRLDPARSSSGSGGRADEQAHGLGPGWLGPKWRPICERLLQARVDIEQLVHARHAEDTQDLLGGDHDTQLRKIPACPVIRD